MGVWLGPMIVKPKPITIYKAGDQDVFTKVAFQYTPTYYNPSDGTEREPTINYESNYAEASIKNIYDAEVGGRKNTSGLLVSEGIDITKYKKVIFNYSDFVRSHANAPIFFYVSQYNDSFQNTRDKYIDAVVDGSTATLDVSTLSGIYYIGILLFSGGSRQEEVETRIKLNGIVINAEQ